jgi:hypothetical protein
LHHWHPNKLWGGSAGGSKSYSARWEAIRSCDSIEGFRCIFIRRELNELQRTHLDKIEKEIAAINRIRGGKERIKLTKVPALTTFTDTDAKIVWGHCQNKGDEEKYLSEDYDLFIGDEATRLLRTQIVGVAGRLRNDTKRNRSARMILITNPGGPAHDYCVSHFLTKLVDPADNPKYDPADYVFIQSSLYDNPYYMDADGTYTTYEKRLYAYAKERRLQLLNGDWTSVVGQFFAAFTEPTHVAVLPIPPGCHIERWLRWNPDPQQSLCQWVACLPDGRLYVFAEWAFHGQVAGLAAQQIRRFTQDQVLPETKGKLTRSLANHDMWPKTKDASGESLAETFRRHGVHLQMGDRDEVLGWGRLRHWLLPHPRGGRWLMYHPDCAYSSRTFPALTHDDSDPAHLSSDGETAAAHAARVGVMARPTPTLATTPAPEALPDSIKALLEQEKQQTGTVRRMGMIS